MSRLSKSTSAHDRFKSCCLSITDWLCSAMVLRVCGVGQKGEGLVRVLFWLLFFWHRLAPDFQKFSLPRCLVDQCDFYLHVKLHLRGLEIAALGVATTLGHGRGFPQADSPFFHSPACPSPLLPVTRADLVWGLSPTMGLWRRGLLGSL